MTKSDILQLAVRPEALERTTQYLAEQMSQFLRRSDRVMICFPAEKEATLGNLFCKAAERCGASVTACGPDYRWKTLLRQAFVSRASTIIAPPLVTLGLAKLARAKGTPLYVRNVVTAGYPCADWMIEGLINALDCKTWGCLDGNGSALVAGFSCKAGRGVHIRQEEYTVNILDDDGRKLPDGQTGRLVICQKEEPELQYDTQDLAMIDPSGCSCGCNAPRLMDMRYGKNLDAELLRLGEQINQWTSVLDCRIERGPGGLEIEIVVFPGEKLPLLPSCARMVVRPWNAEKDTPFWSAAIWKNTTIPWENH